MANIYLVKLPSGKVTLISSYVHVKDTDKPVPFGIRRVDILNPMTSFCLSVLKQLFLRVTQNVSMFWHLKYCTLFLDLFWLNL